MVRGKFYNNNDLYSDLNYFGLNLKQNHKIIDNKIYGFPKNFELSIIEITNSDKDDFIEIIKNSKKFTSLNKINSLSEIEINDSLNNKTCNYQNGIYYIRSIIPEELTNEKYIIINTENNIIEIAKYYKHSE